MTASNAAIVVILGTDMDFTSLTQSVEAEEGEATGG
jgi:hypothetical protein